MSSIYAPWFNQVKISHRLWMGYGLTMTFAVAAIVVAAFQIHTLYARTTNHTDLLPSAQAIHAVMDGIGEARRYEMEHVIADDSTRLPQLESDIEQARAEVTSDLELLGTESTLPEDQDSYQRLQGLIGDVWKSQDQVLTLSRYKGAQAKQVAAARLLSGESKAAFERARTCAVGWAKLHNGPGTVTNELGSQRRAFIILGALTLFTLQIGLRSAHSTARFLTHPLDEAVMVAKSVARGDLTKRSSSDSSNWEVSREVRALMGSLDEMSTHLAALIIDMSRSAEAVSLTAHEISQSNDELAQRTMQQSMSLEQAAASMEKITSIGRNNATNAANADKLAHDAQQAAELGGAVVSQAVAAMGAINECSAKISSIVSVIDEIAFQTNLLALNAAVEAARAGEQGRGFAVVASEVRALALRSAEAAKQIKALISDSAEKVQTGTSLVDRSGQALTEILTSARKMTGLISEIANWSQEQAQGVQRINDTIVHLDEATQQNSALVRQGSAATQTLKEYADVLTKRASLFQIPQGLSQHIDSGLPDDSSCSGLS
jgi:methyl-accepting chemotaxis protein